jgi:hypothetical protein
MQVRRKIRGPSLCARNNRDSSLREATLLQEQRGRKSRFTPLGMTVVRG